MKRALAALIVLASFGGIAYWATAQSSTIRASCNDGMLTLTAPYPVERVSVRFSDIVRLCTVAA